MSAVAAILHHVPVSWLLLYFCVSVCVSLGFAERIEILFRVLLGTQGSKDGAPDFRHRFDAAVAKLLWLLLNFTVRSEP